MLWAKVKEPGFLLYFVTQCDSPQSYLNTHKVNMNSRIHLCKALKGFMRFFRWVPPLQSMGFLERLTWMSPLELAFFDVTLTRNAYKTCKFKDEQWFRWQLLWLSWLLLMMMMILISYHYLSLWRGDTEHNQGFKAAVANSGTVGDWEILVGSRDGSMAPCVA